MSEQGSSPGRPQLPIGSGLLPSAKVPIRQTVERASGTGFVAGAFHLDETYGSLESRVARYETQYAWAEDPPSRIRHFVTGVRATADAEDPDLVHVRSNLLVYRTRQEQTLRCASRATKSCLISRRSGRTAFPSSF
ncbi:aromatic-ring-hydroxylating dioxygenase subunit beta [Streptomyces sp. NPDC052051]|uniref:aromatic-ring-hydroxylating dioxygenase subunit beta n=1 Tax=Streptomyces sp. NPDC052051 TaxID=3154649 RepID=UPI003431E56C